MFINLLLPHSLGEISHSTRYRALVLVFEAGSAYVSQTDQELRSSCLGSLTQGLQAYACICAICMIVKIYSRQRGSKSSPWRCEHRKQFRANQRPAGPLFKLWLFNSVRHNAYRNATVVTARLSGCLMLYSPHILYIVYLVWSLSQHLWCPSYVWKHGSWNLDPALFCVGSPWQAAFRKNVN